MNDLRSPKVVATYRHPIEAEMLANELREQGIDARTTGTTIATGKIEFVQIDVEVVVPAEQLEEARTIADSFQDPASIDWTSVDIGDPTGDVIDNDATSSAQQSEVTPIAYPTGPRRIVMAILGLEFVALACWLIWMFFF